MHAGAQKDSSLEEAIALSLRRDSRLAESLEHDSAALQADKEAEVGPLGSALCQSHQTPSHFKLLTSGGLLWQEGEPDGIISFVDERHDHSRVTKKKKRLPLEEERDEQPLKKRKGASLEAQTLNTWKGVFHHYAYVPGMNARSWSLQIE